MQQMGRSRTVTKRAVHWTGTCFRATIPKEIADRYDIEDGDELLWDDDGDGSIIVEPAD